MKQYFNYFKNYINFKGTSTRSDFWIVYLLNSLIVYLLQKITYSGIGDKLSLLFLALIIIPSISLFVRRLRDINKSPWWALLLLVPLIGIIYMFIIALIPSSKKNN